MREECEMRGLQKKQRQGGESRSWEFVNVYGEFLGIIRVEI